MMSHEHLFLLGRQPDMDRYTGASGADVRVAGVSPARAVGPPLPEPTASWPAGVGSLATVGGNPSPHFSITRNSKVACPTLPINSSSRHRYTSCRSPEGSGMASIRFNWQRRLAQWHGVIPLYATLAPAC